MSTEQEVRPVVEPLVPVATEPAAVEASPVPEGPVWPAWAPAMPADIAEVLPLDRPMSFDETVATIDTPARSPMDYRMPPLQVASPDGEVTAEELQGISAIRSLMWHGNLPASDGTALMTIIADESKRLGEHMSNADFAIHERESDAALRRVFGERYEPLRAKLEALFDDLGRKAPGGTIEPLLEANWHVLISPLVMSRLLQHVERLEHRRR